MYGDPRRWLGEVGQDLAHAVRRQRRSPGFTALAVLTLGLGIGANTAIFSAINGVLLEPLPYDNADRLVLIRQSAPLAGRADLGVSIREFYDYRDQLSRVGDLVEFHQMNFDLLRRGEPDRVSTGVVSPNFFDVLGIRPALGRTFIDADDRSGAEAVLVLGHAYWQSRFGGDPDIVGQVFEMNDRPHTVVGVLPSVPLFPEEVDVYMPTSACPFRAAAEEQIDTNRRAFSLLQVFGLLAPAVSRDEAALEVAGVGERFGRDFPDVYRVDSGFGARLADVRAELTREARPTLLVLLGTTALVLLIACANVANLMLARVLKRDQEMAVCAALGAGRWRLARQPLVESLCVAIGGGALGLAFAWSTLGLLARFVGRFTQRTGQIDLDLGVLLFALGASVVTGVLFGALPAFGVRIARPGAGESGARTAGRTPASRWLQQALVVAQVAVSVVLLVGAGLMLLSVHRLQTVDPGYRAGRVMSADIAGNFTKYPDGVSRHRLYRDVLAGLEADPTVVSAAITNALPLSGLQPGQTRFAIDGVAADDRGLVATADIRVASPGYFATLDIPLVRGRMFGALDHEDAEPVVLLNEAVTREWGGRDPIGSRVSPDGGQTWYTVVGIVGDVRQFGLDRRAEAQVYVPLAQARGNLMGQVVVTTSGDASSAVAAIRSAVRAVDPDMPVENVRTLDEIRAASLAAPRLTAALLSIFAALALAVAVAGVSGTVSTSVSRRQREFGVRMALGATAEGLLAMVLRQGLALVAIGLGLGIVLALALGRVLSGYLFETPTADPMAIAGVAVLLTAVAVLACLEPAWRAARVDPVAAMRSE